jgi:PAS domain S-box-containing protein
VARILVVDPGSGRGREWQTRLVALGHSVPKVNDLPAQLGGDVADLGAVAVVAIVPPLGTALAVELLRALRAWRSVERRLPLLLVAGEGGDWRLQADGVGLCPFAVVDPSGDLAATLREWLPDQTGTDPAVREALQVLGEGVLVADLAGNISFLNRAAEEWTGWSAAESLGRPLAEVFAVADGDISGGRASLRRRDGSSVPVAAEAEPLTGEDGGLLGSVLIFRRVEQPKPPASGAAEASGELATATGSKVSEQELRRTERLEALGHLARGFSHGFNNLLTVILGNISLAEAASRDEVQRGMLQEAGIAGRKAQNLVQQIMVFARGGAPVKGVIPLAPLLRQIVQERQAEHPEFDYRLSVEALEIVIRADAKQLRRLVENLLINAEQASKAKGGIAVICRTESAEDDALWLVIEIQDEGAGMTEDVMRQAFEPFFSTRQPLNATGLGLTVCESIARAHGGTVTLQSVPGKGGSTVTVRLPLAHSANAGNAAESSTVVPFRNGIRTGHASHSGARILVLEDESLIRRLIHTTLAQAGHRVDEAREGQAAIHAYCSAAQAGDPYDLLIMDLTIENGMGGVEAMHRIKEFDPGACAIVSSGYSDDPAMSEPQRFGFSGVLPKPYQPVELVDAVEAMLRAKR